MEKIGSFLCPPPFSPPFSSHSSFLPRCSFFSLFLPADSYAEMLEGVMKNNTRQNFFFFFFPLFFFLSCAFFFPFFLFPLFQPVHKENAARLRGSGPRFLPSPPSFLFLPPGLFMIFFFSPSLRTEIGAKMIRADVFYSPSFSLFLIRFFQLFSFPLISGQLMIDMKKEKPCFSYFFPPLLPYLYHTRASFPQIFFSFSIQDQCGEGAESRPLFSLFSPFFPSVLSFFCLILLSPD